jgi:cyanophycin synthetase
MKLDIGELEKKPTDKIPGFKDRLLKLLPTLSEHRCSPGHPGGFIERIERGTWVGHVTEHVAIELQCLANMQVGFGKTLDTDEEGIYDIVFRYRDEEAGIKAGREAVGIVNSIYKNKPVNIDNIILKLKKIREANLLGPSTKSIVDEAKLRDIPIIRLNTESYVQLGHGFNQRRIQATIMDNTSAIGVEIADDKKSTKDILAQAGIPVPTGESVTELTEAYKVAEDIGYPIVVKPLVGNHGRGITVNITNKKDLNKAFKSAKKFRNKILIEKYIEGHDHRILVIDGKFVAASRREPPSITGNGKSKIKQLIEKVNQDPRRGFGHEKVLTKIEIDVMTKRLLRQKKLDLNDILPKGEVLYLKSTANLSMGGIAIDVTDRVHPMVRYMAERISKIIGLNVIGIDVIAKNLDKPISQTGGGVVEVNAAPGFRMHLDPFEGSPRNVAEPILNMLFPPNHHS